MLVALVLDVFCICANAPALPGGSSSRRRLPQVAGSGNQLAADAGASLRELMDRMGHSTTRGAMVYLHGSDQRQQVIADALSKRAAKDLERPKTRSSGPQRARRRRSAS